MQHLVCFVFFVCSSTKFFILCQQLVTQSKCSCRSGHSHSPWFTLKGLWRKLKRLNSFLISRQHKLALSSLTLWQLSFSLCRRGTRTDYHRILTVSAAISFGERQKTKIGTREHIKDADLWPPGTLPTAFHTITDDRECLQRKLFPFSPRDSSCMHAQICLHCH